MSDKNLIEAAADALEKDADPLERVHPLVDAAMTALGDGALGAAMFLLRRDKNWEAHEKLEALRKACRAYSEATQPSSE